MAQHTDREHVIALRKAELVRLLLRHPSGFSPEEQEHFCWFCRLVEAIFHFEFHGRLEQIKELYVPFDPDMVVVYPTGGPKVLATSGKIEESATQQGCRDEECGGVVGTGGVCPDGLPSRHDQTKKLLEEVRFLLERANFVPIDRPELEQAMQRSGRWGLHFEVNFDLFETLELYRRGNTVEKERIPARFFGLIPEREIEVPIYQRLVLIVRFREDAQVPAFVDKECVYIKLFKDVPIDDLEMLIPGIEPRIRPLDGFKIGLPLFLGILTFLWKLVMGAAITLASGIAGILAWLGIIGAPIGYGVRSYFGYVSTRQKYQLTVTQCLFFQNLDNNLGAVVHLIDEAEEQEFRETLLGWFFLWRLAGKQGWTAEQLDDAVEHYLEEHAQLGVDFEIHDALTKLQHLGLAQVGPDGRWRALSVTDACRRLEEILINYFRNNRGFLS